MECCQREIESYFDQDVVAHKLKTYREKGLKRETRLLAEMLRAEGVSGLTLLDIGGGIGAIEHALLEAGMRRVTNVEASTAYANGARAEAARRGMDGRIDVKHGDFVALAPAISPADVVTLDKVVCCYWEYESLVRLSAEKAGRFYGLILPPDTWWMKLGSLVEFWLSRPRRGGLRFFIHPIDEISRILREMGFEPCGHGRTFTWRIFLYRRFRPGV